MMPGPSVIKNTKNMKKTKTKPKKKIHKAPKVAVTGTLKHNFYVNI